MITFYRKEQNKLADQVDEALDDMVIAHQTVTVSSEDGLPDIAEGHTLPVLIDNGEVVSGEENLNGRLEELKRIMRLWDRFKSDACYIDEDGTIC